MKPNKLLARFFVWKTKHLSAQQYVFLLSFFVGLFSGIGAVILKNSVDLIKHLLTGNLSGGFHSYLFFAYPIIGIAATVLFVHYILKEKIGHGIPSTLYAISKKNSMLPRHNVFSSMISATLTVGFGGSAGLEGPTVATGASIGSTIGQILRVNYRTTTLLLGCGAASAMAGIFNAPVAAIVFAIEVIMLDLTVSSLVPLLIASITAAVTSWSFNMGGQLFNVEIIDKIKLLDLPLYVMLGMVSGLMSVYFSKMYWWVGGLFSDVQSILKKLIIGGIILGFMIFMLPPLYGEGTETINLLLKGNYQSVFEKSLFIDQINNIYIVLGLLLLTIFMKVIATATTFGAGGIGGIFAPTLFMGSTLGFVFSKGLNQFFGTNFSVSNFTLVGMAGMISGVLHAPLTAMFLIAEISGGYNLFLPLMITVTIAFITTKYFLPHSVYTMQLAKRGELITHNKDKAILTLMNLNSEIETDFRILKSGMSLGDLVKEVAQSKRNFFPVLNENMELQGIVTLNDIREIMFQPEMYDKVLVENLMISAADVVTTTDTMDDVMRKFNQTGYWNLPVLDDQGKYLGFISKSKLFTAYRKMLIQFSED